jgi:hypothetical protein
LKSCLECDCTSRSGTPHPMNFPLSSNHCQMRLRSTLYSNPSIAHQPDILQSVALPHYHCRSESFATMSARQANNTRGDPGRSPNAFPVSTKASIFALSTEFIVITRKRRRLTQSLWMPTIPMSSNMHLQSQTVIHGKFSSNLNWRLIQCVATHGKTRCKIY